MPLRIGPCSSSPVIDMPPPMACTTWSKAGRWVFGPVSPKPVTEQVTMRGFTAARLSWSMPRRLGTPTLKLSNTTSACLTRSRKTSRPCAFFRSMQTLRLLRFRVRK